MHGLALVPVDADHRGAAAAPVAVASCVISAATCVHSEAAAAKALSPSYCMSSWISSTVTLSSDGASGNVRDDDPLGWKLMNSLMPLVLFVVTT